MIKSSQNPKIKALIRLKERRHRENKEQYLIEGKKEVANALKSKTPIEQVFICSKLFNNAINLPPQLPITELSPIVFKKISYRQKPEGIIALAKVEEITLDQLNLPKRPLLLAIDSVEKPGNIGALLRTANATGIDAVFITGKGTDLYNPNVICSSIGSLFSQQTLQIDDNTLIPWLKARKISIIATSPQAKIPYWGTNYKDGVIIALGAENKGLSELWLKNAEVTVNIPMLGIVDSLNVATSGALLMYEALKQRYF